MADSNRCYVYINVCNGSIIILSYFHISLNQSSGPSEKKRREISNVQSTLKQVKDMAQHVAYNHCACMAAMDD